MGTLRMLRWAGALGGVGFLCGFIGPIFLTPDSNIAPMIGIVFTGPGGTLLGAVIGGVLRLFDVSPHAEKRALVATAMVWALLILGALAMGRR